MSANPDNDGVGNEHVALRSVFTWHDAPGRSGVARPTRAYRKT
ncbi:hypothetical protein PJI17_22885 [Mycobacterium kansasii]|uniref:Uncharacterized protein n=2 Tax=Mycobacterium kansasii TaxID=1768 RepID=A0A1V3X394_MYCKA|nr:hypothetical protein MKAN_12295 [Mycobacterium kansasii ATCC 12478]ETZ97608.1 hypothetical protein I547_6936 [Mycobacterium kansasii 824]KEP40896.1 hypothetical protein MKSMC1_40220 [Mycobacterium kansasii]OOK72971.1 hypothetical protein BZL29_4901 [Mycobacterium kansasii]